MSELKSLLSANESDEDDFSKGKDEKLQTRTETNSSWVGGLRQRAKTFHGRFSYSDGSAYRDKIMSNKFAVTSQFVVCSKVLTDTIPSRNCDVLMTLPDTTDDDQVMWLVTRLRARVPELILHLRHHSKTNEYGFYLTASYENLLKGAEELSLKKQVKKQYGGGFKEFVYEDREYFEGAMEEGRSFLKSEERQNIVRHLLINLRAEKGDELGSIKFHEGQAIVPILLSKKLVTQVLPLHSHDDLFFLRNNWVQAFFHKQPLDRVCDYFGVKIALYFAYLGYYTKCLLWPAVIGFVFWFIGGSHQYTDDICFVAFAFFNVIWATLYLEGWKREEAIHAYQWGTMDKEDELLVEPRALFHGEVMKSQVTGRFEPSYPVWKRNMFRYFVSFPVILVCLTLVFVVMWTILELQSYINNKVEDDKIPYFFKFIPKILLAVCITLLDEAYKRIATWLNDMENHRLEVSYENNLIVKLVLFQFVNSFLSLFYIAFYLRDMTQLHEHLAALLITRQVIGNLKETIQPYVLEKIRLFKFWYNLVVSLAPEDLQAQMKKLTSKSKNPKRKKKLTGSEDSGEESGSLLEKTDSMNTLEDLENISEISEDFLDAEEVAVADSKSKVEWAGTGMTIGSIKEEDEECEEEDADDDDDRNNGDGGDDDVDGGLSDDKVITSHNGNDKSGEMDAILEEEDEPPGQVAQPEHDPEKSTLASFIIDDATGENDGGDDSDDEEEEEDDLPELTIRASRAAVPGGFLGRKRGFGAQRYTGQRKVSMMVDVKSQLPQLKLLSTKRAQKTKMSQAEVESVMKRYEDTYEDYLEMFIQFGYVTLFSSAFPLAALCAFLNNIIEIRSDAFKLCVSLQRPFGQRVETIGIWQKSLELMSIMAVMVNSALIGMSGLAERMFPDWGTVERIVFIVILEHFVLALKLVLAYAIPDVPSQVAEEKARLEFLRREALKNSWICSDQQHQTVTNDDDDDDDDAEMPSFFKFFHPDPTQNGTARADPNDETKESEDVPPTTTP